MPKASNAQKNWTPAEVAQLRILAKGNTPTRVIGLKMHRPAGGIQAKAGRIGLSLKPVNQSPYGSKKR
ncbi:hypothetical protein A3F64_02330 [Candidatus Saccharibacteria bacterium RIFCSPHIGHO2_12_FULL_42_8]|nr:MAG: hypothetical protein A3F64_02330 [Candidatus Saccharibacteria bacterium RIFCSPHIGHO2_12_FULL_42_8]